MKTRLATALALSAACGTAAAQSASWANPLGGDWNDAANWAPGVVPNGSGFDAIIGLTDPFTVLLNINPTVNSLAITNPLATVAVPSGRSLNIFTGGLHNDGLILINPDGVIFNCLISFSDSAAITGAGAIELRTTGGGGDPLDAQIAIGTGATLNIGPDQLVTGHGAMVGPGSFIAEGLIRPSNADSPGIQLRTDLTLTGAGQIDVSDAIFDLGAGAILSGGSVTGSGGASLLASGSTVRLANVTLDAPLDITGNSTTVAIDASITNNDTLTINSTNQIFNATLRFDTDAAISGTGTIVMRAPGNSDDAQITSAAGVTGTIGTGQSVIGSGRLSGDFVLLGSATADTPDRPLEIRGSLTGPGLIRAENAGFLSFHTAALSGLTIETETDGIVGAAVGTTTAANITNNGHAVITGNATTLALTGDLTNNGSLTINSTDQIFNAILRFDAPAMIGGTGSIAMRTVGNTDDAQITTAAGVVGVVGTGQTVSGSGRVGGDMVLLGAITANDPTANLELRGSVAGPGTLRAENGGFLSFINADLSDLTVETTGDGTVGAQSGVTTVSDITNTGSMVITGNAATLALVGDITNDGTLTINSTNQIFNAVLRFDADAAISGSGSIVMRTAGNTDDARIETTDAFTATISADQTIRGSGLIRGAFVNRGVINADDPTQILDLDATIGGDGVIRADAGRATFNNASINGQTFATSGDGIVTARTGVSTIENTVNTGTLGIDGNSTALIARGVTINNGIVLINATDTIFNAVLELADPTGIAGTGEIILETAGNLDDARIRVPDAQTSALGTGQILSGSGRILGDLTVSGTIRPQGDFRRIDAATGMLELEGEAVFELGGLLQGEFGRISATGAASIDLAGTCTVRIDQDYFPVIGDSWDIISGTNITGRFDVYDLPAAPLGSVYRVFQEPGRVFVRLTCAADFDGDRILNFFDLNRFLSYYNDQDARADLAFPQGVFNFFDITTFISNFNAGCP